MMHGLSAWELQPAAAGASSSARPAPAAARGQQTPAADLAAGGPDAEPRNGTAEPRHRTAAGIGIVLGAGPPGCPVRVASVPPRNRPPPLSLLLPLPVSVLYTLARPRHGRGFGLAAGTQGGG